MELFVNKESIVRKIWGRSDTILFIFAGAAAEFALNKAVDWLFFTGRLPADPLGRLFSTVTYARKIVFADQKNAFDTIDKMSAIHSTVESKRGKTIPDWAYRDVLFMLIDYSIRSFELLERKLSTEEKTEIFNVFYKVGLRMKIKNLPVSFKEWNQARKEHLENNLEKSEYTSHLFNQYKKHLGLFRYTMLLEAHKMIAPEKVIQLLRLRRPSMLKFVIPVYKFTAKYNIDWFIKSVLLPEKYKAEIKALDSNPA